MPVSASSIHVAAATGQPLMAPAPMHQFISYPPSAHPQPYPPQTYQPMVRVKITNYLIINQKYLHLFFIF